MCIDSKNDIVKNVAKNKLLFLTLAQKKLADTGTEISLQSTPDEQDIAFLTRLLVQVTLPHSNPGDIPAWQRRNGDISLVIRPGWDVRKGASVGYPYGSIPRLLLFWLTTEALQTGKRKIELGNSVVSFMRDIGLDPNTGGGKRSNVKALQNQMQRLFRSIINLEITKENSNKWMDMQITNEGYIWWDFKDKNYMQPFLFDSWIELGEKFFTAITTSPVPLDKRALAELKRSPLALDLYAWATYKTYCLNQSQLKQQFIPWWSLVRQFGAQYNDFKDFKKSAKATLRKVCMVYPGLEIEDATGGLMIKRGLTAVPKQKNKRILKTP